MFSICEITYGNDYIVEGYHVPPQLAAQLIKKYGQNHFRVLFFFKENTVKFIKDATKSSNPNDWILRKTKNQEPLFKIAEMVNYYGQYFRAESQKHGFPVLNMDTNFDGQLKKAMELLSK